jgi:hypothetical protein
MFECRVVLISFWLLLSQLSQTRVMMVKRQMNNDMTSYHLEKKHDNKSEVLTAEESKKECHVRDRPVADMAAKTRSAKQTIFSRAALYMYIWGTDRAPNRYWSIAGLIISSRCRWSLNNGQRGEANP